MSWSTMERSESMSGRRREFIITSDGVVVGAVAIGDPMTISTLFRIRATAVGTRDTNVQGTDERTRKGREKDKLHCGRKKELLLGGSGLGRRVSATPHRRSDTASRGTRGDAVDRRDVSYDRRRLV
mmetsp:Transcript_12714/g.27512  ORF Transcript_12714/g.27512 Transcript_12714/m.27512 type:complete len:126 (-) Transcript_12714:103-480(-)